MAAWERTGRTGYLRHTRKTSSDLCNTHHTKKLTPVAVSEATILLVSTKKSWSLGEIRARNSYSGNFLYVCSELERVYRIKADVFNFVHRSPWEHRHNQWKAHANADLPSFSFFIGCHDPILGGVVSGWDSKPWCSYNYSLCGCISVTSLSSLWSFVLYRSSEYC